MSVYRKLRNIKIRILPINIAPLSVPVSVGFWGLGLWLFPSLCQAHSSERGLVMLLPTDYYLTGSAIAVALTFVMMFCLPDRMLKKSQTTVAQRSDATTSPFISWFGLIVLILLLICGIFGSTDPLSNPLPLFVWTFWWIVFPAIQFVFGDLWKYLNPWTCVLNLLWHFGSKKNTYSEPIFRLPVTTGYLIAMLQFFGFAWFELISTAPEDPTNLVIAITTYWLFNLAGAILSGERAWLDTAEPFSIFFRLVGACSPIRWRTKSGVRLVCPGNQLIELPALPFCGVLFVLLTLSTVSFDGISKTFVWLQFQNINPLEFPGRSAVATQNTIGLIGAFIVLWACFTASIYLGITIIKSRLRAVSINSMSELTGKLIYSIIPISLVFHFSHYLTVLLVNLQYFIHALNDPLDLDWSIFGFSNNHHITTSFLNDYHQVSLIWTTQTMVITLGHMMAVALAHNIVLSWCNRKITPMLVGLSQTCLTLFMVAYTVFGLWLLSTASVG